MSEEVKHLAARWVLPTPDGIDALTLEDMPCTESLGDEEVAVRLHAASLNYRDIIVTKSDVPGSSSLSNIKRHLVPGSDGAGIVIKVGSNVMVFKPGDRVITHICPHIPDNHPPRMDPEIDAGLGQGADGTLRRHGHFHQTALVHAPRDLTDEQAATLTCSGLTAYNALFGSSDRQPKSGDWVLVQGSGGVSIAALQFAVAVGANVVATTSSNEKAERLKRLGAKEVINYRTTLDWGVVARNLTPEERGFDVVVDVGGNAALTQSLAAVRTDGLVVISGLLGDAEPVPLMSVLFTVCVVRGIILGTRQQMKDMVRFIETHDIKPELDDMVFQFSEVKEAYKRMEAQKHFAKVVISLQ